MYIAGIKQIIKVKQTNKKEITKELVKNLSKLVGGTEDNVEYTTIESRSIPGIKAGGTVLLLSDSKHTKYIASTVGTSTKDCLCVDKHLNELNYSFEYTLWIDKKITKGEPVDKLLDLSNENPDLLEALRMIGEISTSSRYSTPLHGEVGRMGNAETAKSLRFPGLVVTDLFDVSDGSDVEFEVPGRRGKIHLMQLVPTTKDELEIIEYFEERKFAEGLALMLIRDKKNVFTNRKKSYDFAKAFDDTSGKCIDTLAKLDEFLTKRLEAQEAEGEQAV
jgi:hypothetical protein